MMPKKSFVEKIKDWYRFRQQGFEEFSDGLRKIIKPPKDIEPPDINYLVIKDTYAAKEQGVLGQLSKEVVVHDRSSQLQRVYPFSQSVVDYLATYGYEPVDMSSSIHDLFTFDRAILLQRFPYPRRGL